MDQGGNDGYLLLHAMRISRKRLRQISCYFKQISILSDLLFSFRFTDLIYVSDKIQISDSGKIFNASACGDNCAKWIVEIAKEKDLTINLHHIMDFSVCNDFEAVIMNTNKEGKGYDQYLDEAFQIGER